MITHPMNRVYFGPVRPAILAAIGAVTIIASPPGAIHRPACSIDCPSP